MFMSTRWGVVAVAMLATAASGVVAQHEPGKLMVSFEQNLNTEFKEQNDPVMGGGSSGNFTSHGKFGLFQGTVRNVSFLHAPGFCNAQVRTGMADRLDISDFANDMGGLRLVVRNAHKGPAYQGHKIAFSAIGVPHHNGGHELEGSYKADFKLGEFSSLGKCVEIYVPFSDFSSDWSDFTGECSTKDPNGYQHICCPEGGVDKDPVCPNKKNLKVVDGITVWSEGVAGEFALELYEVSAVPNARQAGKDGLVRRDPTAVSCP